MLAMHMDNAILIIEMKQYFQAFGYRQSIEHIYLWVSGAKFTKRLCKMNDPIEKWVIGSQHSEVGSRVAIETEFV